MSLSNPGHFSGALGGSAKDDLSKAQGGTPMDAAYTYGGVKDKLNNLLSVVQRGEVSENLVSEYLPGFMTPKFQGLVSKVISQKVYASNPYANKNELTFEIVPPQSTYYNPYTIKLYFPLQIRNAALTGDLADSTVAVDAFISKLIKDINIVKNKTEENISPQQSLSVAEYCDLKLDTFDEDHYYLAQQVLHSSRLKTKVGRRAHILGGNTAATIAARTDANLTYRIANYRATQNTNRVYIVSLSLLDNFFSINDFIGLPITIRMTLEPNMKKLFETNAVGNVNDNVGGYNITAPPYLAVDYFSATPLYKTTFSKMYNSSKVYDFNITEHYTKKLYTMGVGEQEVTCDFIGLPNQYNWIKITLLNRSNHVHASVYDSYGGDYASKEIEKITLSNYSVGESFETKIIDLTDYFERHEAYQAFLAYTCSGSSILGPVEYKDSALILHQPSENKYFTQSGYPVYIDLRKSKGYTSLDERADRSDEQLRLRIRLKNPSTEHLVLKIFGIGLGQYKQRIKVDGTEIIDHWNFNNPAGLRRQF